jgi:hypothetical protein
MARAGVDVTAGDELNRVGVPSGLASLHRELTIRQPVEQSNRASQSVLGGPRALSALDDRTAAAGMRRADLKTCRVPELGHGV